MRSSRWIAESHFLLACRAGLAERRVGEAGNEPAGTKSRRAMLLVLVTAAWSQCQFRQDRNFCFLLEIPRQLQNVTTPVKLDLTYVRPTERTKVSNYAFDAFGPYQSPAPESRRELTSGPIPHRSGARAPRASARGSVPTLASRRLEPPRVTGWQKPSGKIRCTTAANAAVNFHGCVMQ